MSELPQTLETQVWGSAGRVLRFERTEDAIKWAEDEALNWEFKPSHRNRNLAQIWDRQRDGLRQIANFARQLEPFTDAAKAASNQTAIEASRAFDRLRSSLTPVAQGTLLTAEHPNYRFIATLVPKDGDAAALLTVASRSDGTDAINRLAQPTPLDAMVRIAVDLAESGEKSEDIDAYRRHLASLGNDSEQTLAEIRETLKKETARAGQIATEHTDRVERHEGEWKDLVDKCNKDWASLKAVYDEKLSLLAPTNYWKTQAEGYRNQGIGYAIAFGVVLIALIVLFATLGVDELKALTATKPSSVVLASLPIIIPAFAGVWVLRILGRQLAEGLSMMKDANERVTLVKTFLALMRDETAGKAVVKEEDRALILHALFRQSRITAVDDAPPINVFEALYRYGRPN